MNTILNASPPYFGCADPTLGGIEPAMRSDPELCDLADELQRCAGTPRADDLSRELIRRLTKASGTVKN